MIILLKHRFNRIAVRITGCSFVLGTLLMLIALMAQNDIIITIGIVFLALYVPMTIVLLVVLLVTAITNFRDIHEHVMTLIIILTNVPIAFLYLYFLNA